MLLLKTSSAMGSKSSVVQTIHNVSQDLLNDRIHAFSLTSSLMEVSK